MDENYTEWESLLGKSTLNEDLLSALEKSGVTSVPVLKRDEWDFALDIGGFTFSFNDPSLYENEEKVGEGVAIFAGITIHLSDTSGQRYEGELPFDLRENDTRQQVREKLGEEEDSGDEDDEEYWDLWLPDEQELIVFYNPDLSRIEAISVSLQEVD